MRRRDSVQIDIELARIEREVLEELHLGGSRTTLIAATAVMAVSLWFAFAPVRTSVAGTEQRCSLACAGISLGIVAVVLTTIGLMRRRFTAGWAAAVSSMIGSFLLTVGFWSLHTGPAGNTCLPLVSAACAGVVISVTWMGVLLSPLSTSHPDCRLAPRPGHHDDDRNDHGCR